MMTGISLLAYYLDSVNYCLRSKGRHFRVVALFWSLLVLIALLYCISYRYVSCNTLQPVSVWGIEASCVHSWWVFTLDNASLYKLL